MVILVRPGEPSDLDAIVAIQEASRELSPWQSGSLLEVLSGCSGYGLLVAGSEDRVGAFLLWREIPDEETEILSLAVKTTLRRNGFARALLEELFRRRGGDCFLEVRVSNLAAQALYRGFGFEGYGLRRQYYHRPVEDALVMRRSHILPEKAT